MTPPRFAAALGGGLLAMAGALMSSGAIEAFFGRSPGALAWGPLLFRMLLVWHGLVLIALALSKPTAINVESPRAAPLPWMPLAALSILALVLRLIRLDTCLWLDEIFALTDIFREPIRTILSSFPSQNQHMLYSLMAHASLAAFGETAWAVRLPAVLFGVASIWALFLLGRTILGQREALLAAALMTASYHGVWFSQNARGYTGLLFFSLLATWLWIEAENRSRRWWAAYAVVSAAGLSTHLTMAFVLASHGLVELIRFPALRRRGKSNWPAAAAMVLAGTLALQVYAISLPEFLRTGLSEVSLPSQWTNPLWALREGLRSLGVAFSGVVVAAGAATVAAAGWFSIHRRNPAAAWGFVLPGLISGAAMVALGHNIWPRFFYFCMGFALLVSVHGVMRMPAVVGIPRRFQSGAGMGATVLLILASAVTVPLCYRLPKQDFTGARDFVERRRRPDEVPVAAGLAGPAYAYYAPSWIRADSESSFTELHAGGRIQWLVYTLPPYLKAWQPGAWRIIERDFEVVREFPGTLGEGAVYVCRRRGRV